jgi:hypothetical protein
MERRRTTCTTPTVGGKPYQAIPHAVTVVEAFQKYFNRII